MDVPVVVTTHTALSPRRKADRRAGLHDLVREVATDCVGQSAQPDLPTMLIGRLRRILTAKSVRLHEITGAPTIRTGQPVRARDYVAYAVPVVDASRSIVLEASFPGELGLDDWSCQLLEAAASLATLLFEVERLTRMHDRPGGSARDGAAPLIGSSLVMQGLRERVERVATTDFTVLIEGAIGAQ